jgi:hypothetical protein
MAVKTLPEAWESRFGKRPLLAETFVDPEGYKGTCYHASGWSLGEQTKGYKRVAALQYYEDNKHPKHLQLKPLAKDGVEQLRDPSRLLPGEDPKARAPGAMPKKPKVSIAHCAASRTHAHAEAASSPSARCLRPQYWHYAVTYPPRAASFFFC